METGAIARRKGSTKEVRDFGAMLARDHQVVRRQGRDLVKKLGVRPTPPADFAMAKDHAAALRTLRARSGKEFDRQQIARLYRVARVVSHVATNGRVVIEADVPRRYIARLTTPVEGIDATE